MREEQKMPLSSLAVVGAGPVGLALALHASRTLHHTKVTLIDARKTSTKSESDPRSVALSLGSVQFFQRLGVWHTTCAQLITQIDVSQKAECAWAQKFSNISNLRITAAQERVPFLGAVLGYSDVTGPLQQAWTRAEQAEPQRLFSQFGQPVTAVCDGNTGIEVQAGFAQRFDLVVMAEGTSSPEVSGAFLIASPPFERDYAQVAWVGEVGFEQNPLQQASEIAFERFTAFGPVALLPLKNRRSALVWCTREKNFPIESWNEVQRIARLNEIFHGTAAGRITCVTALKPFPLHLKAQRTLTQGRLVRIGNAAQTLHPVAGQGLNLGLRDAFELVQQLARTQNIGTALRQFEWERARDRWSMVATTDFLARSFTWQIPAADSLRGLGLVMLNALKPVKSTLARRMMFGVR
jgi:2-octaprenyl-6-methoxyphenol hydroxylase